MGSIVYSASKLYVPGKVGVIPAGADGWYSNVPMGGLGCLNSGGAFYLLAESRAAFENSVSFMRRASEGCLYSEFGHPKMSPGMKTDEFFARAVQVYEDNACNALANITLMDNGARDRNGKPICLITGDVKPWGPQSKWCTEALTDPKMNACYSIRCITSKRIINGLEHRVIEEVYTFDLVLEPGIYEAKKRFSPSLESHAAPSAESSEFEINMSVIKSLQTKAIELDRLGVSVESANNLNALSLRLESYYKRATTTAVPFVFNWTK